MTLPTRILTGFALGSLLACGGGDGPTTPSTPPKTIADMLTYTNPTLGDYKLIRNTSLSTSTHLVLDLVGPTGNGRGVAFTLSADTTKVTWAKVASADAALAQNVAFNLGSGSQIQSVKANGDVLQAGFFQKGTTVPAVPLNGPLARVALDLRSGSVAVNNSVALSAVASKANVLPETGAVAVISVSVGTLQAQ